MSNSRSTRRRHLPTSPFKAPAADPPLEVYAVQDRVSHDKYGLGRVVAVEDGVAVTIDFGQSTLRVMAPYHKLIKL